MIDFTVVKAVVELLKVGNKIKMKRELCDLLSNNFTRAEVDKAIHDAEKLKWIKQTGLIKARNHEQTTYKLERYPI